MCYPYIIASSTRKLVKNSLRWEQGLFIMFSTQNMHYIQKDIIHSLTIKSPLRFSELQPTRIANNTFSYHLKKLLEAGYITSTQEGYVATRKALKTIQYRDHQAKKTEVPALITVVYMRDSTGNVLLLKRHNKPFTDWYGIPSGLIHQGESIGRAAERELYEKTGIIAKTALDFVGVLDFKYLEEESGDLFVHAVSFIYTYQCTDSDTVLLDQSSKHGSLLWSDLTDEKILPEVHKVAELVNHGTSVINSVDFVEPLLT